MDWSKGFSALYYATIVDPVTWSDLRRIEITGGTISRTESGLMQSADIDCIKFTEGNDKWLRIWLEANQAGEHERLALFAGLTSNPKREIDGNLEENSVQCYSVLKPAQDVYLPRGWFAGEGAIGSEVVESLLSVCKAPVTVAGQSPRLSRHIIAEDGETRLSMTHKVLDAVGWRIVISGNGNITICAKSDDVKIRFTPNLYDVIEPKITVENDWFDCPNVFRAVTDTASAEARDDEEDSKLSTLSRGREVWKEETGVTLSADETVESYASRRLKELQSVSEIISYNRRYHPDILPGDTIELNLPNQKISGRYQITSQKITLGYGARVSEEVQSL